MRKLLLSAMAVSAIATSTFAQAPVSGNQANLTSTGYNFQFDGALSDNCEKMGVPGRDISTEFAAYATYSVSNGQLVIDKDGSKQAKDWESFPLLFTDAACNVVEIDLSGGAAVEIKVNSSVAVPQMMFTVGNDDGFADNSPVLQPLSVGDNTITASITDWKTWEAKAVDNTKIKAAVLGFRTSYDDVTKGGAALISGTFKVDYIKIGNQAAGFESIFESNVIGGFLKVYPSPATSEVNINFEAKENVTVSLTDVTGRVVLSQNVAAGAQNLNFNVSTFSEGMYFVNIVGASGSHTEKLMVK
ncbi:MAG: T9SS type A sorting domain-containing protein [Flavobacteriales bacterium]